WLLTADQFDEVEIREVSCFGAVPMKSGIPAAEHTPPKRNRQAHFMELSFHLLLRNSHGRDAFLRTRIHQSKSRFRLAAIGRLTSGGAPRRVIRRCRLRCRVCQKADTTGCFMSTPHKQPSTLSAIVLRLTRRYRRRPRRSVYGRSPAAGFRP